jgi:hypothetical protein
MRDRQRVTEQPAAAVAIAGGVSRNGVSAASRDCNRGAAAHTCKSVVVTLLLP